MYKRALIQESCSTICGHCLILLFIMGHTFSVEDRSRLQAGSQAHPFYSVVYRNHSDVACAELDLALSFFPGKMSS